MTIQELLEANQLSVVDFPSFADIAALFCAETRFAERLVINEAVYPGMLGVFFARIDPKGPLRLLRNNCLYIPCRDDRNMVVCDVEFLTNWRNVVRGPNLADSLANAVGPDLPAEAAEFRQAFFGMFRSHLDYVSLDG